MKRLSLLFLLVFIGCQFLHAQTKPRYWDDVQTIKNYDKIYNPPANPILFVGSSSIRKWDDLERTFASYVVMNRGVGGAVINDIIGYANDLIFPYHPRQIFIYVGENDLVDQTATADSILQRTKRLIQLIRAEMPDVPVGYISIKPSPVRAQVIDKAIQANDLIRNYLKTQKNIVFIDVFKLMITPEGKSRPELFGPDMLHMNKEGYEIWRKAIEPYLLKR